MRLIKNYLKKIILPSSTDEDRHRRELILNILLFFSVCIFLIINIVRITDKLIYTPDRGLPLWCTLIIMLLFLALLYLSRRGLSRLAAIILVSLYATPMFYSFIFWGADLPAALLLAVLIIILSGITINSRSALISTSIIIIFLIVATELQNKGLIIIHDYWRQEKNELSDAIVYSALLSISAIVAWLFAREISRALRRARLSEAALKLERDSLEVKVIEKTKELRQAEAEKISQLYRLAEFGRLSSGIFHDLINPLTAISLNLEQIDADESNDETNSVSKAKSYLGQAITATRQMEKLIGGIKKQIQQEEGLSNFSLNKEIDSILEILNYKARRAKAEIYFSAPKEIYLSGDAIKFSQIITNLLSNAIDACEASLYKIIKIEIAEKNQNIEIKVSDQGVGIDEENITKIFEPFFSTKKTDGRGLGIGLSSTKNLVEKSFQGQIAVKSRSGQGAIFTVTLPKGSVVVN